MRSVAAARRCLACLLALGWLAGCGKSVAWLDARERSEPLMQRARSRQNEGDPGGAIRLYVEALQDDPSLALAHLDVAFLLHDHAEDYVRAIHHYRRYLELRPATQKREMIENRVRLAEQQFAATIYRPDRKGTDQISALAKATEELDALRKKLETEQRRNREVAAELKAAETALAEQREKSRELVGELRAELARAQAEAVRRPPPERPQPRINRTYQVRAGDSLSSIAADVYGDASQWEKLYEANREVLDDISRLRVGQVLTVP